MSTLDDATRLDLKFRLFYRFSDAEIATSEPAAQEFYALLDRMRDAVRTGRPAWATYHELVDYAQICYWGMRKLEYSFAAAACASVEANASGPLRILDVGCGVVPFCNWLSRRGHLVTAIDPDRESIEFLQANDLNAFYGSDVQFQVGRGEDLQFANESFDLVTCVSVLEHLTPGNDRLALREIARVLKPGGALVISFDVAPPAELRPGEQPWPEELRRYAEPFSPSAAIRLLSAISPCYETDPSTLPRELHTLDWATVDGFWRAAQQHDARQDPVRRYLAIGGALVRRMAIPSVAPEEAIVAYREGQDALQERLAFFQAHALERDELVRRLDEQGEDLRAQIEEKQALVLELNREGEEKDQLVLELNREGEDLRAQIEEKQALVLELNREGEEKDQLVLELNREGEALRRQIEEKQQLVLELNREGADLRKQLEDKDQVIVGLKAAADERLELIERISADLASANTTVEQQRQAIEALKSTALGARARERARQISRRWYVLTSPRLGVLEQYEARPLAIPPHYSQLAALGSPPLISIVTPSLNQGIFIERTLTSVLGQQYPRLEYIVQDGGSRDGTVELLERYRTMLTDVAVQSDNGFGQAINRGFSRSSGEILAYLNSDDMLLPGALHYVANFFERNPEVDVVYGHRVIINSEDGEIGRWVLPPHDDEVLSWADYVPQETLFWRRRIWDKAGGGIDESFRFAIDWDLLLRFRDAGARMRRLPRFLGAFRFHPQQKTSAVMLDTGYDEMNVLRRRSLGREVDAMEISRALSPYMRQHFVYHKLFRLGLLRY